MRGDSFVEWMRTHAQCRAIAIERKPSRLQYIADNTAALRTPNLQIIQGKVPTALKDLPTPDAIFLSGGITAKHYTLFLFSV